MNQIIESNGLKINILTLKLLKSFFQCLKFQLLNGHLASTGANQRKK